MAALYTHTTRANGTVLTATIYNGDHQNHIDNGIPQELDDYSISVGQMQTNTNPGGLGSESLPTSLAGEIERLRFAIAAAKSFLNGGTVPQWYEAPSGAHSGTDATLSGSITMTGLGKSFSADFSNATETSKFLFTTRTANGGSIIGAVPNGTSASAAWRAFNNTNPTNAAFSQVGIDATAAFVESGITGTGTQLNLSMRIGGAQVGLFTATGLNNAVIGATTRAAGNFTTVDANSTISATGNISSTGGSVTANTNVVAGTNLQVGTGGTSAAGVILSDATLGMLFRAKQASPSTAIFRWADSADVEAMRITTGNVLNLTNALPVASGGTGLATLTANNVILGNGTGTPLFVAPGTSGNILTSNGTTWTSAAGGFAKVDRQIFTASGTWTKPSGLSAGAIVIIEGWGAGGSGGVTGGAGGGGYSMVVKAASALGATESATVAGASSGGADGGNSSLGAHLTAFGGGGSNGGAGGGVVSAGSGTTAGRVEGGASQGDAGGIWGGAGGTNTGTAAGSAVYGGGGGGSTSAGAAGTSRYGGNGGASGVAGSAPAGGGGANANGARGEIRVTTIG